MAKSTGKRIGVALGSGGARGLSQIGFLLWLKERRIEYHCIAGCSIGAIIGGHIAAGYTPEHLRKLAAGMNWIEIVKFFHLSFSGSSIFTWDRIYSFLRENLDDKRIEHLKIPFACVAADIDTGDEIKFKEGDLVTAISASSSISGIFPPIEYGGRNCVDGELVNPLPLDLAFELGAEVVVGVNVTRPVFERRPREEKSHTLREKVDTWVKEGIEKAPKPVVDLYHKIPHPDHKGRRSRMFYDVITDSYAILSSRVLHSIREKAGSHLMIEPPVGNVGTFDFAEAEAVIDAGYEETRRRGDEILAFVGRR